MAYIDKDIAIKTAIESCVKVVGQGITHIDAVYIAEAFEDAPTADVVEVVQCKDCEYCHEYMNFRKDKYHGCNCNGEIYKVSPTHYCGYGKRKGGKK